jgi:23S rRNA (adenine2503-C2)-methyltransferase
VVSEKQLIAHRSSLATFHSSLFTSRDSRLELLLMQDMDLPTAPLQSLTRGELETFFAARGLNAHQARLTFQNLHRRGARVSGDFEGLSIACARLLDTLPRPPALTLDAVHRSDDGTLKMRIATPAGGKIEAVLIPSPRRVTLCVSSQVGCAAGCTFCHTGTMGLLRNLDAWEIVEQHRLANALWLREHPARPITNIVFMGMGEPLHNEASVLQACRILGDRHSLAVSLHATTDEVRDRIVPLNRLCNLAELRRILLDIPWRNRETLTVAYLLLEDVNDLPADAQRLAAWVSGLPVKVNLLEFNPYPGSSFKRSAPARMAEFRQWLRDLGVFNTLRHSRGADAMAACGQLASEPRTSVKSRARQ